MSISSQKNNSVLDINGHFLVMIPEGTSRTFEMEREQEEFEVAGSSAVTVDIKSKLVAKVIERKNIPSIPFPVHVFGTQDWDRIQRTIEKLNALDAVFGMLNELTPEQRKAFEDSVKRRPFFK